MKISIDHALNIVQNEVEDFIFARMEEGKISAGLMEKVLEGVLSQIRKLKNKDLEQLIIEINSQIPVVCDEKVEEHTATIEEVKTDVDLQSG